MMQPQQRILFLDTSGPVGLVALAVDGHLQSSKRSEEARDHAAVINLAIADVLNEGRTAMAGLTGVCVLAGPGSYTGLRIGLATAKGLCYALDIPLFLQSNLEVLAADVRLSFAARYKTYLCILPARKDEYFMAAYDWGGEEILASAHLMKDAARLAATTLPTPMVTCGSATAALEIFPEGPHPHMPGSDSTQAWIYLGFRQIASGQSMSLAASVPFYLKQAFTTTPKTPLD